MEKIEKHSRVLFITIIIIAIVSLGINIFLIRKSYDHVNKIYTIADSLQKENDSLKVQRTILIQEQVGFKRQLDSLSTLRPKNIKNTNNAVSRLYNSTTPGKLSIIDSILRSRKGQR